MQKASSKNALKILTISLLLIVCGYSMSFNILSNTMDPLVKEFSLTGASQGLMSSMISFGSMLPLLIIPLLQGRIHKIWLILIASILQILMLLLTGISGSFGLLLFSCVLLGAGNNTTDSCVNSYMVDLHPENSAGVLGLLHGFYGIGGLLTPILVSFILEKSGWRPSYYVAAAIFAAITLVFAIVGVRSIRGAGATRTARETPLSGTMLADYVRSKRNMFFLGAAAFCAASQIGLLNWVVRYTSEQFGDAQTGSMCLTAYWVCTTICRLVTPRLKFRPGSMMIIGMAGAAVFNVIGVFSGSAAGMLAASALIGAISGNYIPLMISEATRGNEDRTSLITSGIFLLMGLGRMAMPLGMGAVSASSMTIAMLLPAGAAILCGLCSYMAGRSR